MPKYVQVTLPIFDHSKLQITQVRQEWGLTWYDFAVFFYLVHQETWRTRYDFTAKLWQVGIAVGAPAKLSRYFLTRYARKCALPGMISRPNCDRWGWTKGHLPSFPGIFLPGTLGKRPYLVWFRPVSYQVHHKMSFTWYDFTTKLWQVGMDKGTPVDRRSAMPACNGCARIKLQQTCTPMNSTMTTRIQVTCARIKLSQTCNLLKISVWRLG